MKGKFGIIGIVVMIVIGIAGEAVANLAGEAATGLLEKKLNKNGEE